MLLNYEYQKNSNSNAKSMIFIHGLFGSLSNLGMLARVFAQDYNIIQVDVRNHGKSSHSDEMNYELMAQDIIDTLDHLNIQNVIVVGHSMGGKISMKLSSIIPTRIEKLVVLDIAPYAYTESHHDHIFKALFAVQDKQVESRQQAIEIMKNYISEEMVIQFLLKSFSKNQWLFNVSALYQHYSNILSWSNISASVDTLFIRGGQSPYIAKEEYLNAIQAQFTHSQLKTVNGAGHWLHAEKAQEVTLLIQQFLAEE